MAALNKAIELANQRKVLTDTRWQIESLHSNLKCKAGISKDVQIAFLALQSAMERDIEMHNNVLNQLEGETNENETQK